MEMFERFEQKWQMETKDGKAIALWRMRKTVPRAVSLLKAISPPGINKTGTQKMSRDDDKWITCLMKKLEKAAKGLKRSPGNDRNKDPIQTGDVKR
jgi:hypothetical protein